MDLTHQLAFLVLASLLACATPTYTRNERPSISRSTYIVRVLPPPKFSTDMSSTNLETWYRSFLPPVLSRSKPRTPFIHTYREAILGFAVNLTKHEVEYVKKRDGVLKVYEDYLVPLLTIYTPDFLGLRPAGGVWSSKGMGEGSIIGVLDTGIHASHRSFDDEGMKPPPEKWRGACNFGDVKCNKKLIGFRSLLGGQFNPKDTSGHGTHTASTAAGRSVEGASFFGYGSGTASGMAPHAHLAVYQVCNPSGCYASNILAGMDAAIADGVDILSISIGGRSQPFDEDVVAMGAFSAMSKGIFVSCSAGNSGPFPRTIMNEAPWVLTVGASTINKRMKGIVELGDDHSFVGESAYQPSNLDSLPLLHEIDSGEAKGTLLETTPAPVVAHFSSRGPSTYSPGILKPDIIGPGVSILAAWPFKTGFNILSGTSMSAPHLSGIAAIIKSANPGWSPAAIKSAIMTTAYVLDDHKNPIQDDTHNPAGHFSIGAGHVNPSQAVNPGLIYDIDEEQYISYLCGLDGYTDSRVEIITHRKGACREGRKIKEAELNYPSIAVKASTDKLVVSRTVTNVGDAKSSYTVDIKMPKEVTASVSPSMLEFTKANEKKTFTVSLSWDANAVKHAEGAFKWVSDKHVVRSPIVIF